MNLSPSPFSKNSRTQTLDIYTGFFFAVPLWVLYRLVDFFCWFLIIACHCSSELNVLCSLTTRCSTASLEIGGPST